MIFCFFCRMIFHEAKTRFYNICSSVLDVAEIDEVFFRLMQHLTQKKQTDWIIHPNLPIDETKFENAIHEILQHKPIQYITGIEWFDKYTLQVNEHTLIPRPETTELVHWLIDTVKQHQLSSPEIIDIGTGSGCIPIMCKDYIPDAQLWAMDISQDALLVAKKNAAIYHTEIDFFQDDIEKPFHHFSTPFDMIISNPPYILPSEKNTMSDRVILHEPHLALFVSQNDPLQFYKAILRFADTYLKKNGFLFFETHRDYAHHLCEYIEKADYSVSLRNDMYGAPRMICAQRQ